MESRSDFSYCHPIADIIYSTKRVFGARTTRATIIYQVVDNHIKYQVVFTAPGDNFCRKKGREHANEKLKSEGPIAIEAISTERPMEVIFGDICANHLPSRWLNARFTVKAKKKK